LKFYHSIAARGEDVEEVLRLAELDEDERAITEGKKGTKAVPVGVELQSNGNGDILDDEREDGEVDEENDVSLASAGGAERGASKTGTVAPQTRPAKCIEASTEQRKESRTSEMDASADTTKTAAPGKTTTSSAKERRTPSCAFSRAYPTLLTIPAGQDQILENIKMAYWWAGYYSGLYEGQQQVQKASTR
jgi:hypothetical protein